MFGLTAGASLRQSFAAMCMAAVTITSGATMAAAEPQVLIKAAHAASATNTGHLGLEFMDKELRARTDGRVGLQIFPNAQLGGEREAIESIQLGNLDMTFVSSAPLANFNKQFFAFDIPFLFPDRTAAYRVLDGEIGQELLASLDKVGLHGLGYWENGFRQLTNDVKEVREPADLSGMKMRTMENEMHLALWRAEGADPAPLSFSELFTALQQGTFDAQEGPINLFYDMKFYEVQKFITETNHIYSPFVILVSPDLMARMSPEDQKTFLDVFAEARDYQRKLAREADDKALAAMPQITLTKLSPEEKKDFVADAQPVIELVKGKVGAEIVDKIIAAANAQP